MGALVVPFRAAGGFADASSIVRAGVYRGVDPGGPMIGRNARIVLEEYVGVTRFQNGDHRWSELGRRSSEETGARLGDRVAVAETILAVERLAQRPPAGLVPAGAVGFGDFAVVRRVGSLLEEPKPPRSLRPLGMALGLAALALLLGSGVLHHTTESLISVIAH